MSRYSLNDLNEYIFDQIDALTNDDLEGDALEYAIRKAEAVGKMADTVIRNGELQLKIARTMAEYGSEGSFENDMKKLIEQR